MLALVPYFRSDQFLSSSGEIWSETILVALYKSLFLTNLVCAILATAQYVCEWLYLAKHQSKRTKYLVIFSVAASVCGILWIYPQLKTSRIYANQEIQKMEKTGTPSKEAVDQLLKVQQSQVTYYEYLKKFTTLYHWVFVICSILWIFRLGKNTTQSRGYHF